MTWQLRTLKGPLHEQQVITERTIGPFITRDSYTLERWMLAVNVPSSCHRTLWLQVYQTLKFQLDKHFKEAVTADSSFQSKQWQLQDVAVTARSNHFYIAMIKITILIKRGLKSNMEKMQIF